MTNKFQDNYKTLVKFADAFNTHNVNGIMGLMTDDCTFVLPVGVAGSGTRVTGQDNVRMAFEKIFSDFPDSHWADGRVWVCEDRGFSEWRYSGTMLDGTRVEADGCDLFIFRDGKIAVKDAYRKQS